MSRLDRYLEALRRDRRPRPFRPTDDEAAVITTAIMLSAARPDATSPRPEFVHELGQRLRQGTRSTPTRRGVVIGGSVAAGAAIVGATVDRLSRPESDERWHTVAASDAVPEGGAIAFDTGAVSGFVIRQAGELSARSGVCTHQGCHLRLNGAERRLDCPCHRTRFGFDGQVITSQLPTHPARLPAIQVREREGQIEVYT